MNIDEILEEMDELIDKSTAVPFVPHKKVVDGERMRELVNDIRLNLPHELKEAKKIEFDCQRILNEAKLSAEGTIRRAEERAVQLVSKEAIVTEARKKAAEILKKAQNQAMEGLRKAQDQAMTLQKSAALSVAQMLNDAENSHQKSLLDIKRTKEKLQHNLKSSPSFNHDPQAAADSIFKEATTEKED